MVENQERAPLHLRSNQKQISGSRPNFTDTDGHIYKVANQKEFEFYKWLEEPQFSQLRSCVPSFQGTVHLYKEKGDTVEFEEKHRFTTNLVDEPQTDPFAVELMKLVDLTKDMQKPCLLDVKLASKPYNPKKLARQQQKIDMSTCKSHGFRLCGFNSFS